MDAGDTLVNTGADAVVTVVADADDLEAADSTTVTADATGVTNSMSITTTGEGTADVVATSGQITNIDTITVVDSGDAASGATARGDDFHIDLASYGTALTGTSARTPALLTQIRMVRPVTRLMLSSWSSRVSRRRRST